MLLEVVHRDVRRRKAALLVDEDEHPCREDEEVPPWPDVLFLHPVDNRILRLLHKLLLLLLQQQLRYHPNDHLPRQQQLNLMVMTLRLHHQSHPCLHPSPHRNNLRRRRRDCPNKRPKNLDHR